MKKNNFESKSNELLIELPKVSDKSLAKKGKGWVWDEYLQSYVSDWEVDVYADGDNGWSGNSSSDQVSSTVNYQHGMDVVNEIQRDLQNDEVVTLETSKSADGSIDVVNSISLAVTAKNASHVIIDALKANAGIASNFVPYDSGNNGNY